MMGKHSSSTKQLLHSSKAKQEMNYILLPMLNEQVALLLSKLSLRNNVCYITYYMLELYESRVFVLFCLFVDSLSIESVLIKLSSLLYDSLIFFVIDQEPISFVYELGGGSSIIPQDRNS